MELKEWLPEQIGQDIWTKKYRENSETLDQFFDRISNGNKELRDLLEQKKFLFGGRILANRGLHKTGRKVTYSNCFVGSPPSDNLESIFDCAKSMAKTYSMGGGVGIDLSKLRPRGSITNNAAKHSTGAVSFSELFDTTTGLISQNGRRGALILTLSCEHPDLEEFIDLKSNGSNITKANISIRITDAFMYAVSANKDWTMTFTIEATGEVISKTVKAKLLFDKIVLNNWNWAEPGMLFWDTIENNNLLSEDEDFSYAGTNPCAEEPLPENGSCLLGSLNLSEFVWCPFTENAEFDFDGFARAVSVAVIAMNDVLDEGMPLLPLKEQRECVENYRQIGLGIMGLADMLLKLSLKYGEQQSISICDEIAFCLSDTAIGTSAILAQKQGIYAKYKPVVQQSEYFINNTSDMTKVLVKNYGLRNSQLLTTAPTGTLSTMLGISGGIEPIFSYSYTRKTESLHGQDVVYKIYTPIVKEYMKTNGIKDESDLPYFFTNAREIPWTDRINMQATLQRRIDASISSTVNLPNSATVEDIYNVYMYAWKQKLKGITVYREGCKRDGILVSDKKEDEKVIATNIPRGYIEEVPTDLQYRKYKLKTGCGNLYFFVGVDEFDGKIYDCFTNTDGTGGCTINTQANSRLLSAALRGGLDVEFLAKQLEKAGVCPSFQYKRGKGEELCKGKS
jgi:ribonucleoside-diphosphate reductase alpha chain